MKLSSSGALYPTKLPTLGDGTWFNGPKVDPKWLFPGSCARSFEKIKNLTPSRNKQFNSLLRDGASFLIDAYAKEWIELQSYFGSTLVPLNQVPSPKVGNFVGYKTPLELSFIEIPFGSIIIEA